jgi:NADH-quinone oxidoreductase subunit D
MIGTNEMEDIEKPFETKELTISMGPQHPATHGVLRIVLQLSGENVVKCTPYVGYLHRGIEKLGETKPILPPCRLRTGLTTYHP